LYEIEIKKGEEALGVNFAVALGNSREAIASQARWHFARSH